MKSLLSEVKEELTADQQKIVESIDIEKTEDEITDDLIAQNIVSFEVKNHIDVKKDQNNK